MQAYYFIYLFILLVILFLIARYLILKKKSLAVLYFIKAVKAENNGHYREAVIDYENALIEVKKTRFHKFLEIKIIEKLRVLRTLKVYDKDQSFVRENNSWLN